MKKLAITAIALAILLFSCDNGNMEGEINPFVGTWEANNSGTHYIFTKNYVTQYFPNSTISWSGNYTYNDTYITIHTDYRAPLLSDYEMYPNPFVFKYEFKVDLLLLGFPPSTLVRISD